MTNIKIKPEDLEKVAETVKPVAKTKTSSRFPEELTRIFTTLGAHSPKGMRMPNSAKNRRKSTLARKRKV